MANLTREQLAAIEKTGERIAAALDGEPPTIALYALESVSSFVICQAKDYQSALKAHVIFHDSISDHIAMHFGQDKVNQNVN